MNQNRLSDRDIAQDLLSDLKELALGYHMATVEASSQTVRDTFKNNHDDWMNEQHGLWQTMYSKGWYQPPLTGPGRGT